MPLRPLRPVLFAWLFNRVPWFYNYSASGRFPRPSDVPGRTHQSLRPNTGCLFGVLIFVTLSAIVARNLTRGSWGQMDGHSQYGYRGRNYWCEPAWRKLSAFAISSPLLAVRGLVLCGLPGVLSGRGVWHQQIILVLFMIIIGGLGSIFGSFCWRGLLGVVARLLEKRAGGGLANRRRHT